MKQLFKITEADNTMAARIAKQIQGCETLEDVKQSLLFESSDFSDYFIYRGSAHVAVHIGPCFPRLALITKND